MASIRLEDEARTDPRFKVLGKRLGTTRFDARARMEELWSHCTEKQTYVLHAEIIDALAEFEGFHEHILDPAVGLAVPEKDMIRIRGTRGRIEWLAKLRKNGRKGGRPKKTKPKPDGSKNETNGDALPNPLTLTLTPTLVIKKREIEKKENLDPSQINRALEVWGETLKRHSQSKDPKLDQYEIGSLIQVHGLEKTLLALYGAGFEEGGPKYNPSKHVSIRRLLKPPIFDTFVNLGDQERTAQAMRSERAAEHARAVAANSVSPLEDWPEQDPEKAREYCEKFMANIRGAS